MNALRRSDRIAAALGAGLCLATPLPVATRPAEARVRSPQDGASVTAYVLSGSGSGSGRLTLSMREGEHRVALADGTTGPATRNACDDKAWGKPSGAWPKGMTIPIRQHPGPTASRRSGNPSPSELDWALAEGVRRATHAVTDCVKEGEFAPPPNIDTSITGRTSRLPGTDSHGACGTPDGTNTVGFADLPDAPPQLLAITCVWRRGDRIIEADTAMRADHVPWWMSKVPAGRPPAKPCPSGHYDAVSVATHEALHFLGLSHVQGSHPGLTLTPSLPSCSSAPSTLGLGDYLGLIHLYGPASAR